MRPHVLCIDDDRGIGGLTAEELVNRGFKVSLAYDGEQGLQAILTRQPDAVPSDILGPVLSGFDLLEPLIEIAPRFEAHTPPPPPYLSSFRPCQPVAIRVRVEREIPRGKRR